MLTDIKFEKEKNLNNGINYHQIAQIYSAQSPIEYEVFENELSYCDILDLKTGLDIISEFYDVKASAIIKFGMPSSVALGSDLLESFQKAFDCDPIGSLNSTLIFSSVVDENIAVMIKKMNFNVVAAPNFNEKALQMLISNDKIKVVKINTSLENYRKLENYELDVTPFGMLVQSQDKKELDPDNFKVISKTKPTAEQIEDAVFAWKLVKHAKSQSIVVAKDFKTLAISQGNTNLISAFEQALDYACNESKDAIIATDALDLTVDNINAAAQARISLIIASEITDEAIVETANKYNIVLINTGITHISY